MSEPTKEEMKVWLGRWHGFWTRIVHGKLSELKESEEVFQALLSLIISSDKGPEVDERLVKQLAESFYYTSKENYAVSEYERRIFEMLYKAGVRVKEEK